MDKLHELWLETPYSPLLVPLVSGRTPTSPFSGTFFRNSIWAEQLLNALVLT